MQTKHDYLNIIGVTTESIHGEVRAQLRNFLKPPPPGNLQLTVYMRYNSYFLLFEVGVLCRNLYCLLITSVGEERAAFLLSITCNFIVSVRKSFLFLWILRKGCIIYFWAHPGPSILSRYNGKL